MCSPPQDLDEAIEVLHEILPRKILHEIARTTPAGLEDLRSTVGNYIRDEFGLAAKDSSLRAACETDDPDDAALTILQILWYELNNPQEDPGRQPYVYQLNVNEHLERYFNSSSFPAVGQHPEIVVLMGGIAVGKTTIRKDQYARGYVLIDAAELFGQLNRGEVNSFPGALREPLQLLGNLIARRAISERRNIVTEIIGADLKPTEQLLAALRSAGYRITCVGVGCDADTAQKRLASRPATEISAYEAEHFTIKWLIDACLHATTASSQ